MTTPIVSAQDAARQGPFFIVLNAGSGRNDSEDAQQVIAGVLSAAGRAHEFLKLQDATEIERTAKRAVTLAKEQRGIVVAAGGDGTINAVAQAVLGSGCPFGVIPQGTFNYFARVHGIAQDTEAATRALLRATVTPTQVGLVNERIFLVNGSLGLYPQLLQDREAYKQQFGRSRLVALLSGVATLLRQRRQLRLSVESDGSSHELRTPTLFVGNNQLQLERIGITEAEALQHGQLVALAMRPIGTLPLFGLALRGALGQLGEADNVRCTAFRKLTVRPQGRRRVKVATDGEIHWMQTPLVFEVAPEPLLLLVPAPQDRVGGGMSGLLQISDPHFGTEQAQVLAALTTLVAQQAPEVLVLSGDITQRARRGQFDAARRYVEQLQVPDTLVIPGNHDIPMLNLYARLLHPYANHQRAFGKALEPVLDLPELLLIGVNTTRAWRHKDGEVSLPQIRHVAERLHSARPEQLRIVITHQPLHVPRPQDEHNLLHGHAAAAHAWADAGADLVMGGHIHLPYVLPLRERHPQLSRPLWCVQAGTAVSSRIRREAPNSVNLIRYDAALQPPRCIVERWDYHATLLRFDCVQHTEIPLERKQTLG